MAEVVSILRLSLHDRVAARRRTRLIVRVEGLT